MQGWRNRYNDFEIFTWCEETPGVKKHFKVTTQRRSQPRPGQRGECSVGKGTVAVCSGCIEGLLASEVILGQEFCGNVWEFS